MRDLTTPCTCEVCSIRLELADLDARIRELHARLDVLLRREDLVYG